MLVCPECNSKQGSGKFCGVCGGTLVPEDVNSNPPSAPNYQQALAVEGPHAQSQSRQSTETAKNSSSQYFNYFLYILKNPTRALHTNENHFSQGIITLILYAVTFSLSIYFLINSLYKASIGRIDGLSGSASEASIPFFTLNSRLAFYVVVFLAISFVSALVMIKAAKSLDSAKKITANFGGIAVPLLALNSLAMLTGTAGSIKFTLILLCVSYLLLALFIPMLLVFEKASKLGSEVQQVYISLATVLLIVFINYLIGESILSGFLEDMDDMLSMFNVARFF